MALETITVTGDGSSSGTSVKTTTSEHTLTDISTISIPVQDNPSSSIIGSDGTLAISKAGSGKQLKVTSDGTLVGTTVETADGVTELTGLQSVTISIGASGLRVGCRFSSTKSALVNSTGMESNPTKAILIDTDLIQDVAVDV